MSARANQNLNLNRARAAKNDEFYTQRVDIERELAHYKDHFRGKTVLCNCDDPRVSNFFHYFSHQFEQLELKKLVTTCYKNQERDVFSRHDSERAISLEYHGDRNRIPDPEEIGIKRLRGDGDFRSEECMALMNQADIVVTNPPFSLFREYVNQLIESGKKFLILGSMNAITYKEVFRHVMVDKIWLGVNNGAKKFGVPDNAEKFSGIENGKKIINMGNVGWYTNLDVAKRHEKLVLYKKYSVDEYPKFDNYDAINVDKTKGIPVDYAGVMGVPISFLDKYNPDQFEIIGLAAGNIQGLAGIPSSIGKDGPYINGKLKYGRIFIRHKQTSP
ncbi:MAG: adenine-specific methyltransferase EcoRI family protein [Gammaproteobacteria bacterium]|nr:adenine-specific methyltransferase EcoRI family protein [Gammaproteobacteria bacterium]MDD9870310.1 adenine-specific methyltransferase EcoRI family protein [Gammaproteobacteria bacterium]